MATARAGLVYRGAGMIYDSMRNITWLADMNYAGTSGYAAAHEGGSGSNEIFADGRMGWNAALDWADNLVYGGYSDWRLASLNPTNTSNCSFSVPYYYGFNCTGGELSGLFITDLGNKAGESVLNQVGDTAEQIANLALFSNVKSHFYWSGTQLGLSPANAWGFSTGSSYQNEFGTSGRFYVVAVRDGDVAATLPEPQTLALALLALGATVVSQRRRPG